jgi:hypothetical protein
MRITKKDIIASILNSDKNLKSGCLSTGIRIQPTDNFNRENFKRVLENCKFAINEIAIPGDTNSLSSKFETYIITYMDKEFKIVLGQGNNAFLKKENLVLQRLQNEFFEYKGKSQYLIIKVNKELYKVDYLQSTPGTPKSDFHFSYQGVPVLFISHKDGKSPKDFQQYSGIGKISSPYIFEHNETSAYNKTLLKVYANGMQSGDNCYRLIRNKKIKLHSIYGCEYNKQYSYNNVQLVCQGSINIEKKSKYFTLNSHHIFYNGEIPQNEYEPIYYSRYTQSSRNNARSMLIAKGMIPSTCVLI